MGEPFFHSAILQRLGTYLQNGEVDVFYSPESFSPNAWGGIPLIFTEVVNDEIHHPDFTAVTNGNLPPEYRFVGKVEWPIIPDNGQPRLEAQLSIIDAAVEQIAREGRLGLSTGFTAQTIADGGEARIVGTVVPNHVLLFEQGACPNCFPNDNGAMFLNTKENEEQMTDESKMHTLLQQIHDKLFGNTEEEPVAEEVVEEVVQEAGEPSELEAENEQLKNTVEALKKELDAYKAEAEQRAKDTAWNNIKNTLPEGWLGAKETETRAEFENSKDAFYQRLMAHKAEFSNAKAMGATSCGCKPTAEAQLVNALEELKKKTGFRMHGKEE